MFSNVLSWKELLFSKKIVFISFVLLGFLFISCEKYPINEIKLYQITFSKRYSKELLGNKKPDEANESEIRSKIVDFINGNVSRSSHLISFQLVSADMIVFDVDLYGSDAKRLSKNSKISNVIFSNNRVEDPFK